MKGNIRIYDTNGKVRLMMTDTPLLQLRQSSDNGCGCTHAPWVYFHLGCEQWVQENQQTDGACDLVGIFIGNYPLPDWIQLVSSRSLGIGGKDGPLFMVQSGAHPVDVYGKTCTWYHYRGAEDVEDSWPFSASGCTIQWHSPLGKGLVMLNKDDPDYDKYERHYAHD